LLGTGKGQEEKKYLFILPKVIKRKKKGTCDIRYRGGKRTIPR
jgi:hypothetical protein